MSKIITIHDLSHGHTTYTKVCDKIDRVGIELEGNFISIPDFKGHFTTDGSIEGFERLSRCDCTYEERSNGDCECEIGGIGEYISDPIQPDEVADWIAICHPTETNRSTGGHIHVSLNSASDYMTLMRSEFQIYLLEKLTEWGHKMNLNEHSHFWERIEGKNLLYKRHSPLNQHKMTYHYDNDRYTQINYCYNVEDRHTIEIRILPAFQKKELQISGTLEILKIIQEFLEDHPEPKPITLRISV